MRLLRIISNPQQSPSISSKYFFFCKFCARHRTSTHLPSATMVKANSTVFHVNSSLKISIAPGKVRKGWISCT